MEVHYINQDSDQNESRLEILKNQIQSLDSENLLALIAQLEGQWCLDCRGDTHVPFKIGFEQFFRQDELDENRMPNRIDIERVSAQNLRQQRMLG